MFNISEAKEYGNAFIEEAHRTGLDFYLTSEEDYSFYSDGLHHWLREYIRNHDNIVDYEGATRIVLCDEDKGFVIKLAISNEDQCYNENEAYVYSCARAKGLDSYFAGLIYAGNIENLGVYVGEYVHCDESEISGSTSEYLYQRDIECGYISEDEYNWYCGEDSDEVLEWAEYEWGEDFSLVYSILHNCGIGDLHSGNWGYKDGQLVVVDYAGFNGECARPY